MKIEEIDPMTPRRPSVTTDTRPVLKFENGCIESAAKEIFATMRANAFYLGRRPGDRQRRLGIYSKENGQPVYMPRETLRDWICANWRCLDWDAKSKTYRPVTSLQYLLSWILTFASDNLPVVPQ